MITAQEDQANGTDSRNSSLLEELCCLSYHQQHLYVLKRKHRLSKEATPLLTFSQSNSESMHWVVKQNFTLPSTIFKNWSLREGYNSSILECCRQWDISQWSGWILTIKFTCLLFCCWPSTQLQQNWTNTTTLTHSFVFSKKHDTEISNYTCRNLLEPICPWLDFLNIESWSMDVLSHQTVKEHPVSSGMLRNMMIWSSAVITHESKATIKFEQMKCSNKCSNWSTLLGITAIEWRMSIQIDTTGMRSV